MTAWKKDCVVLFSIVVLALIAGVVLISLGGIWAPAFGVECLMTAVMFAPCAAWRLTHRDVT